MYATSNSTNSYK
ncbi:hypothetical protein A2U01_0109448, partial [Trifolium medium]|nr:hypothetical protein [Trifolium medium]